VFTKSRQLRSAFPIRFQIMPSILRVAAIVAWNCFTAEPHVYEVSFVDEAYRRA